MGAPPKAQPAQSKLACPTAPMASERSLVSAAKTRVPASHPHLSAQAAQITNSVLTFLLLQLRFVLPGEISFHFLKDQPLYEV